MGVLARRGKLVNAEVLTLRLPAARQSVGLLPLGEAAPSVMNDQTAIGVDEPTPCGEEAERRAVFDAALVEHRAELHAFLVRQVGDRDAAADLTQEALSRMMTYRDAPDIASPKLLLFRVAHNLVAEFRRQQYRHRTAAHVQLSDAGPLPKEEPPVEAIVDARRAIEVLVKRTLLALPPRCALAFMLNRFDGLSYPQVAQRMGISVKMVEKHIARALVACRDAVGDRDF